MLAATFGRHQRQLATTWNELTGQQLLAVAQVHGQEFARPAQRLDALLRILVQLPARAWRRLTPVHRVELRPRVAFLTAPADVAPLTAQLLPRLTLPHYWFEQPRHYYGPREAFRNLRFDEFIFADTFFLRYVQTGEDKWLDQLVATLYRPQRAGYDPMAVTYQGDRREDFNEHLLPARAKCFGKLPAATKYAVLLYYRGCRHQLEQRYEYVFTAGNTSQATNRGWQDVLHELAGGVQYLEATAHQSLPNVLREMNRVLRLDEERRQQQTA